MLVLQKKCLMSGFLHMTVHFLAHIYPVRKLHVVICYATQKCICIYFIKCMAEMLGKQKMCKRITKFKYLQIATFVYAVIKL